MRRREKKKKGFTLIEVVAGMAMFAIVSAVIVNMIVDTNRHNALNKDQFDTHAMSRTFNEAIKTSRPATMGSKLVDWTGTDRAKNGTPKVYFIGVNTVEDLTKAVKETLLIKSHPSTGGYDFVSNGLDTTTTIEQASNGSTYKYGVLVKVQKKEDEKVYLFDTVTMYIPEGALTSTTRQFAISSEV